MTEHSEQVIAALDRIHAHSFGAPISDLRFDLERVTDYIKELEEALAERRVVDREALADFTITTPWGSHNLGLRCADAILTSGVITDRAAVIREVIAVSEPTPSVEEG